MFPSVDVPPSSRQVGKFFKTLIGCHKIRLMMWSDRKIPGLEGFGIDVVERVPISSRAAARNKTTG